MLDTTKFVRKLADFLHGQVATGKLKGVKDITVRQDTVVVFAPPHKQFRVKVAEQHVPSISMATHECSLTNRKLESTDDGIMVTTLSGSPIFELPRKEFEAFRSMMDAVESTG